MTYFFRTFKLLIISVILLILTVITALGSDETFFEQSNTDTNITTYDYLDDGEDKKDEIIGTDVKAVQKPSVESSVYENQNENIYLNALISLSIIKKDEITSLDGFVKRKDFAKIICRFIGLFNAETSAKTKFLDVSYNENSSGSIKILSDLSIMNGYEGNIFLPENYLTYNEAVKIIISSLSYDEIAKSMGGYPVGYLSFAINNKIIKDNLKNKGDKITFNEAFELLYNSLDVLCVSLKGIGKENTYSSLGGKTVLTQIHNANKKQGIVEGFEIGENESTIYINGIAYKTTDKSFFKLLGNKVTYIVKNDENRLLYIYKENEVNEIIIDAEKIKGLNNFELKLLENSEKTIKLSNDFMLFYNNKLQNNFSSDIFNFENGNITLLDNNFDNAFDCVFINKFESFVVSDIDYDKKIIFYKNGSGIALDDFSNVTFVKNNQICGFDSLKIDDTISVLKSYDNNLITIYISGFFEGKINEVDNSNLEITIDYKKYKASKSLNFLKPALFAKFYKDINNRIFYYEAIKSNAYGYLLSYENALDSAKIKLFCEDGKTKIFKLSDRISLNKSLINSKDAFNKSPLTNEERAIIPQLITFELNEKDEISKIETATYGINPEIFSKNLLKTAQNCSTARISKDFIINNDTLVFLIPNFNSLDEFKKLDINDFYAGKKELLVSGIHYFEVFDCGLDRASKAVILYYENLSYYKLSYSEPFSVIKNLSQIITSKGEIKKCMTLISKGVENRVVLPDNLEKIQNRSTFDNYAALNKNATINDLKAGDIIQIMLDKNNELINFRPLYVKGITNEGSIIAYKYNSFSNYTANRIAYAKVFDKINNTLFLNLSDFYAPYPVLPTQNTKTYIYNRQKNTFTQADVTKVVKGSTILIGIVSEKASEIIILE